MSSFAALSVLAIILNNRNQKERRNNMKKKLVKIVHNPDGDTYSIYMHDKYYADVPIAYLEQLQEEIARVFKEVSA